MGGQTYACMVGRINLIAPVNGQGNKEGPVTAERRPLSADRTRVYAYPLYVGSGM